ncbi:unnamed protein product [Ectocarpus sp. 12 AP-2014]
MIYSEGASVLVGEGRAKEISPTRPDSSRPVVQQGRMHWGALPTKQAKPTTFHPLDDRTRGLQLFRCCQEQSKQPESVRGLCRNCRHSFAVDGPKNDTVQTPKMPTKAVDLTQLRCQT